MTNSTLKSLAFFASLTLTALCAQTGSAQEATTGTTSMATPAVTKDSSLVGRPSLGLRVGYANTEGKQKDAMDFGVEAGYRISTYVGTALELGGYSTPRLHEDNSTLSRLELLAKGTFHPVMGNIPVIKYMNLGAGVGPVYDHIGRLKRLSVGVAPQLGIDIPASTFASSDSQFTVGAVASYLFVSNGMPDTFSASGVAKYWF